jgi:hypothetical protein
MREAIVDLRNAGRDYHRHTRDVADTAKVCGMGGLIGAR